MRNNNQICGSLKVCSSSLRSKPLCDLSTRSVDRCWRSIVFSLSDRNLAVDGDSGRSKSDTMPRSTVMLPNTTNIILQLCKLELVVFWNPKDRSPPMICPAPRPQYQKAYRGACSDLSYHRPMMSIKLGTAQASNMPIHTRHASKVG